MGYKKAIAREKALRRHLRSLGIRTAGEYQLWCERNGFSPKLYKHSDAHRREQVESLRSRHSTLDRRPAREQLGLYQTLKSISTSAGSDELSQARLRRLCEDFERNSRRLLRQPLERRELKRLALHVHNNGLQLHTLTPAHESIGESPGNTNIEGVFLVALHRKDWIRPLHDWRPPTEEQRPLFASLLRHLFVRYDDMPRFFDAVWFSGGKLSAAQQRSWYLHVGGGRNIRHCQLPIAYTKRMAHFFMHAPDVLSVDEALRWGQVIGSGGNPGLARAICRTQIAQDFSHDEFWRGVIRWFVAQPELKPTDVGTLVDFLYLRRQEHQGTIAGPTVTADSLLKGRTVASLLRQVGHWHDRLGREEIVCGFLAPDAEPVTWNSSGLPAFTAEEGSGPFKDPRIWKIRELLDGGELAREGRAMNHCVATYAPLCVRRQSSIWSMRRTIGDHVESVLTIEVRLATRSICQARGFANRLPTPQEIEILKRWAARAKLTLDI